MLRGEATNRRKTPLRAFGTFGLLLGALFVFGCALESDWVEPDWARPVYSEEEIEALFAGTDFQPIRKVQDVPEPVQTASRDQDPTLTFFSPFMANPGEPFNWGDVVSPGLASKRLIFGGRSANRVFLYFEQGGYGGPVALCEAYETTGATARQVPIENFWRNSKQDDLVYLKHLMQDWPEATRDPVASNPMFLAMF
jgi:hypothetical protein